MTLRAEEIVAVLDLHKVRYVVIGGLGAVTNESPTPQASTRFE